MDKLLVLGLTEFNVKDGPLALEEKLILVQEEHCVPVQEETVLPVQEERRLLEQEEDLVLVQSMLYKKRPCETIKVISFTSKSVTCQSKSMYML